MKPRRYPHPLTGELVSRQRIAQLRAAGVIAEPAQPPGPRVIFRPKNRKRSMRIYLTDIGHLRMDRARLALSDLTGWPVRDVSNSEVSEYLARGDAETRAYLKRTKR